MFKLAKSYESENDSFSEDSDDSVLDANYEVEIDVNSNICDGSSPTSSITEETLSSNVSKNGSKVYSVKNRLLRKSKRNTGQEYVTARGFTKQPRQSKPLTKCRRNCVSVITADIQELIFINY